MPTDMHFSRFIAAPLTLVWRAHTEQGQLERWCGPEGYTIITQEMDVRQLAIWCSRDWSSPVATPSRCCMPGG